jgi:hypothetical protein
MEIVYLSRRNLLTLLSKLDRKANGEETQCTLIKRDNVHPKYPQTMESISIVALEDEEYYTERKAGPVSSLDEVVIKGR